MCMFNTAFQNADLAVQRIVVESQLISAVIIVKPTDPFWCVDGSNPNKDTSVIPKHKVKL